MEKSGSIHSNERGSMDASAMVGTISGELEILTKLRSTHGGTSSRGLANAMSVGVSMHGGAKHRLSHELPISPTSPNNTVRIIVQ